MYVIILSNPASQSLLGKDKNIESDKLFLVLFAARERVNSSPHVLGK